MSLPWPDLTTEEWESRLRAVREARTKPVALTYRAKLAFLLGGEGSGNFGHAGRPGEVGGSAPDGDGSHIEAKHREFVALVKAGEDDNAHLDELREGMREAWNAWSKDTQNRKRPLKPDGAAAKKLDSYKQAKALEEAFHKEFEASRERDAARDQQARAMLRVPKEQRSSVEFKDNPKSPVNPLIKEPAVQALATFRQFDGSGAFSPLTFPADKVEKFREVFGDQTPLEKNADGSYSVPARLTLSRSEYQNGRAHATIGGIAIGGGRNLEEAVYHEVAHHIEMKSGAVLKAAIEFRESLADKPREVFKLNSGHNRSLGDDEMAVRGKFPDPYTGKVYPGDMATEIVSTGVESYIINPVGFARSRPEHFEFIFNVMHGKYRGK